MRKINKIINIALIFMLMDTAGYSKETLRAPIRKEYGDMVEVISLLGRLKMVETASLRRNRPFPLKKIERETVIKLASSRQTYGNPNNRELYKVIVGILKIRRGVAIDFGSGTNTLPAQGLIEAGLDSVIMIDENPDALNKGGFDVSEKIIRMQGDTANFYRADNSCAVVVFNQSISFIGEYGGFGRIASEDRFGKAIEQVTAFEIQAKESSLKEAYRVLMPGGWVLIKPGEHLQESRDIEGHEIEDALGRAGFRNITVLNVKGTAFGPGELSQETKELFARQQGLSLSHIEHKFLVVDIPVFIFARKPSVSHRSLRDKIDPMIPGIGL